MKKESEVSGIPVEKNKAKIVEKVKAFGAGSSDEDDEVWQLIEGVCLCINDALLSSEYREKQRKDFQEKASSYESIECR